MVHQGDRRGRGRFHLRVGCWSSPGILEGVAGKFVSPRFRSEAFTCPRCDTLATQQHGQILVNNNIDSLATFASLCSACVKFCIWERRQQPDADFIYVLVYPGASPAPLPNEDLPDDAKAIYDEASAILNRSPKGAAALLRLAIQLLCKHLGQPGKSLNDDIAALVKEGLTPLIQQAMDTVRITGNESVHPGEIKLDDDRELALALFDFVNLIAEDRITTPKRVQEMYDRLPEGKRAQVETRDRTG